MTTVTPTGGSATFGATYDGNGLRAVKTAPGTGTVYFLYDLSGTPVVEESYNSGTSVASITNVNAFGADGWRERYSLSASQFTNFAFDPQGTLVQRALSTGSSTQPFADVAVWDGYGQQRSDQSTANTVDVQYLQADPVGFEGQYGYYGDWEFPQTSNPTTNLYLRQQPYLLTHRYYDPSNGRFINRDPTGYNGGPNLYAYAGGNPINRIDPSGYDPAAIALSLPKASPALVAVGRLIATVGRISPVAAVKGGAVATVLLSGTIAGAELINYQRSGGKQSTGFTLLGDKIGTYLGDRLYPTPKSSPISSIERPRGKDGRYLPNPNRTKSPEFDTAKARRVWEKDKGRAWPKDPTTGENFDVGHIKKRADGGALYDPDNITPIHPKMHDRYHAKNGPDPN